MKKHLVVIGAGLCGSLLAAALRDRYRVTVIERGRKPKPLRHDVTCDVGEVNTSINRAEGLGGTTNYWHNALIELEPSDLRKARVEPATLRPHYDRAWRLFLSADQVALGHKLRDLNAATLSAHESLPAHMVIPRVRHNAWEVAGQRHPGAPITLVQGRVRRINAEGRGQHLEVETARGLTVLQADTTVVCAGGIGTPLLLAKSVLGGETFRSGYHDHPTAYVAKIRLKPGTYLRDVSCRVTPFGEVRAGLAYEVDGLKTVVYLRPALDLNLRSIQGPARFILSDLRNDPFSPRKILRLLRNPEAVREAVLFKSGAGFAGACFSILVFGEQTPVPTRGISFNSGTPRLHWQVTPDERHAYWKAIAAFVADFADHIDEARVIEAAQWEFRTGAHHSGAATSFLREASDANLEYFSVAALPGVFACDGSVLKAAGIANSGLTLLALTYRLADLLSEQVS